MLLSKKQLNELNDILIEDYGKKLNQKHLFEVGTTLVSYFELLAKIYQRNKTKGRCYEEHTKDRP
ncbi:hypothetical protein C4E24_00940 [ANME-1 cluster archaeon AG-394-G21]|nr:hypothetical protein [ANME-1 cluster archaeon AG-394-G21]